MGTITRSFANLITANGPSGLPALGTLTVNNIQLPSTQVASANANNLDDYEEGTFTPAFLSTSATFTYSVQKGVYTKIGRQVCFNIYLQLDGAQTLTANPVTITGLPFTSANISQSIVSIACEIRLVNLSAGATYLCGRIDPNVTSISLLESGDNYASTVLNSDALSGSSGQVFVSGTYPAS